MLVPASCISVKCIHVFVNAFWKWLQVLGKSWFNKSEPTKEESAEVLSHCGSLEEACKETATVPG